MQEGFATKREAGVQRKHISGVAGVCIFLGTVRGAAGRAAHTGLRRHDGYGRRLITSPKALPEGSCTVDVTVGGVTRQMLIQVSNLSLYYMVTGEETLVWANDAATGKPLEGATITFAGNRKVTARTDSCGIAQISGVKPPKRDADACSSAASLLLTVQSGNQVLVGNDLKRNTWPTTTPTATSTIPPTTSAPGAARSGAR